MRPSPKATWTQKSPNASARRRSSGSSNRSLEYSLLEPRALLAAVPIISEFVASNNSSFDDGYGNSPDWIELHNAGDMALDLADYHLTDNSSDVDKWTFQSSTVLEPGQFLVVFASSRDEIDPAGFHHTNFKLSAGGEYIGLAAPDGTILSEFGTSGADYPAQVSDISYGTSGGSLISDQSLAQYLIPSNGALGNSWTANDFVDTNNEFSTDLASFGYENSTGSSTSYAGQFETELPSDTTSVYVRTEFDLADASAVNDLTLSLQYDDGFAAYLNGAFLFSRNADNGLAWNDLASASHNDVDALRGTTFKLDGSTDSEGNFLNLLVDGKNTLAIHGLNRSSSSSDFLLVPTLTSNSLPGDAGYLLTPTPGAANADPIILGPAIENVTPSGVTANSNQPLTITASISDFSRPVDTFSARLHYRSMFANHVVITMNDSGLGVDSTAGDGIFSASIPASALRDGEMIRWYVTVSDIDGNETRAPRFLDPLDSAEYFGTVVTDPAINTDVPLFQWFVADEDAARTQTGTRGSLFYNGEFYDNIQFDGHGQSTATFDKTSFDFDANSGEKFLLQDGVDRASDFNLITNYADQTKIRNALAYGLIAEAGLPSHLAFSVTVYRNGEFYGLYDIIEEGDEEFLERTGLDPNGSLYKVNNPLNSAYNEVEKKSREYEDHSDFQAVINANNLSGSAARTWDYDNLDIADAINFLAVQNVIQNRDYGHKNNYWYLDNEGTGLWSPLPWDVDLSLGHNWNANPSIQYFDNNLYTNVNPSIELNNLFSRLVNDPIHRELFYRRVRTLMDQFYGAPGTPTSESLVAQRIDELSLSILDEAAQDRNLWGLHPNYAGSPSNVPQAIDQLKNDFISGRRSYLEGFSLIPDSQIGNPEIRFDDSDFDSSPISGLQSEEYLRLNNPTSAAVDISGWTLTGGINHVFKGGTVIPAGGELFVVADVVAFKARSVGPQGGQQRIIQGNYDGQLSNTGEVVNLQAADGSVIDSFVTPLDGPTDNQQFLRVSEINYHPTDVAGDAEYIEFLNTSSGATATTLDLSGVTISEGPSDPFVFANGVLLQAGERLLVVNDVVGFISAYPSVSFTQIAGEYSGSLSDGGENIRVDDASGETIHDFDYNDADPWALAADGAGGSLQLVDEVNTPLDQFGKYYRWRSSVNAGGTPGAAPITVTPTVVINEVLAHTDSPEVDFIELYNPTDSSINVGGWYLSDSATQLQKYQIPANSIIAAGGYLLIDENDFNPTPSNPGANDFALSSSGEEVWLTQFAGGTTTFGDVVSFGATFNGESLGRIPNGSGRLTPLNTLTPNEANSSARIGPLLITEINYHPSDPTQADLAIEATLTSSDLEFIEVYNSTSSSVDLTNWQLRGEADFDLPAGSISGQTAFLITSFDPSDPVNTNRTAAFRTHYGLSSSVALVGGYSGSLSNSWGRVELQQPDPTSFNDLEIAHVTADEFVYDDLSPWADADGNGFSLQRIAGNVVGHLPSNWDALTPTPGVVSLVQAVPQVVSLIRDGGNEERPDLIETISITFDTDVIVSAGDLSLRNDTLGGTVIDTTGLLFNYDSSSQTATWDLGDLAVPLEAAYYSVILSDDITTASGGVALDGDGDDFAGGNFEQSVYVALPGDANLDGVVDVLSDAFIVVASLGQTEGVSWAQGDFNNDGTVNVLGDAFELVANLGRSVVPPSAATSNSFALASSSPLSAEANLSSSPIAKSTNSKSTSSDDNLRRDLAFAEDAFWFTDKEERQKDSNDRVTPLSIEPTILKLV